VAGAPAPRVKILDAYHIDLGFHHRLPKILDGVLRLRSSSFSRCAAGHEVTQNINIIYYNAMFCHHFSDIIDCGSRDPTPRRTVRMEVELQWTDAKEHRHNSISSQEEDQIRSNKQIQESAQEPGFLDRVNTYLWAEYGDGCDEYQVLLYHHNANFMLCAI
jgi:hypothetical protein